jgi:lipoprotein-anchoring transpeptidase ErfK/SrfK
VVPFSDYRPGNIVIVTHARQLYFVLGQGRTIRYPVGVGRAGMAWHGRARIARKDLHPRLEPPDGIWRRNP